MVDAVKLMQTEMMMAAYIGAFRRTSAISRGLKDLDHPCEAPFENDIVSAQAELAVSKYLNLYWSGMRSEHPADVGDMIEVRCVTEPHHRLIVRQRDRSEMPFVSVYAKDDKFEMRGWLFGEEVKVEPNRQRPNGGSECWLADTNTLAPFNRLRTWIEDRRKLLKT